MNKLLRILFPGTDLNRQVHMAFGFVAGLVLVAAAMASAVTHWLSLQETQKRETQALAQVLASNLAASVLFQDKTAASQVLQSLSARHDVDCALVIDQFGQALSGYALDGMACQLAPQPDNGESLAFGSGGGMALASISAGGNRVGSVIIQINQREVKSSLKRILWILCGALLAVLVLAYPFSRWLSARIARPINELVELMARVAREGAYSTRAREDGPEEVRRLGWAFNHMLQQIEAREQALEQNKQELETRIEDRTAELRAKQAELEILARTDGLTGLHNRRYFMEQVDHEFRRAQRQARPLSIIMLDLDHFKQVNDNHGHQTGDQVLAGVARVLREAIRGTDLIGRFGGEEFVLALPETDAAVARDLAERLCQGVRQWQYVLPGGQPPLHTSCSLGVATWRPGASVSLEEVFRHADAALYQAKEQGRDRVVQA